MGNELSITLVDAQPYYGARKKLCEVLDHGTKKLAFACAFLTEPGGRDGVRPRVKIVTKPA